MPSQGLWVSAERGLAWPLPWPLVMGPLRVKETASPLAQAQESEPKVGRGVRSISCPSCLSPQADRFDPWALPGKV
jgi:hypothetical protein